jgi:glycosyltransferase involved in cell wall biosynthesis
METPRIFSVIEGYIGHRTYGQLMQDYFSQSESCKVDFYWHDEDREMRGKILRRLLSYQSSNLWVRKQNLDLFLFRFQLALAYLTRRILLRNLGKASYSALHLHTQPLAFLCLDLMQQYPTIVSIDRTALQAAREQSDPSFYWTHSPNIHLEKKVFQAAQKILSFSEAARRSVIDDYGISPEKVTTVYTGIHANQITPALEQPDRVLPNILFIGGDFERKGGNDLLQVFLDHFSDQATLHLVTSARPNCNHPNVHIYNGIKAYTSEWLKLYYIADLFVMPTYSDCTPWVFLEAMAAGLPIITTRVNAIPEIVIHGDNGLLIERGDRTALAQSIQRLLENREIGRKMGLKGRQLVEEKFNAKTHFSKLEVLFQEAISPSKTTIEPVQSPLFNAKA